MTSIVSLDVPGAAKFLNITVKHVRRLARNGKIGHKVDDKWSFTKEELTRYETLYARDTAAKRVHAPARRSHVPAAKAPHIPATKAPVQKSLVRKPYHRQMMDVSQHENSVSADVPLRADSTNAAAIAHHIGLLQLMDKLVADNRVRDGLAAVTDLGTSLRMFAGAMQALRQFEHGGTEGSVKDVTEHVRKLIDVTTKPALGGMPKPARSADTRGKPAIDIASLAASPPPLPPDVHGAWTTGNPKPSTLEAIMRLILEKLPGKQWATIVWIKECCQAAGISHQFDGIKWALHTLETAGLVKRAGQNDNPSRPHKVVYWEAV